MVNDEWLMWWVGKKIIGRDGMGDTETVGNYS